MSWLKRLLDRSRKAPDPADAPVDEVIAAPRSQEEELLDRVRRELFAGKAVDAGTLAQLSDRLCERLDYEAAMPLLTALIAEPKHRTRAHAHLAEGCERAGAIDEAIEHWASVIAYEFDYPGARRTLERLHPSDARGGATSSETLAGVDERTTGIGDRYRLRRELGRGGAGTVYVAWDERLEREVALKILHPHRVRATAGDERSRAWLEAKLAATMSHPNVITIYDLDERHQLLTMELCHGGALASRIAQTPITVHAAISQALALLSALGAIHECGIVHGDIKPSNIFLRDSRDDAELVLSDFGIARFDEPSVVGDRSLAMGTLAYLPPEARHGREALGPLTDVYASAVVCIELLHGSEQLSSWLRDTSGLVAGTARWNEELPAEVGSLTTPLTALLQRMLAERPEDRPTARAAHDELLRVIESKA